ncbi:MAG: DUF4974 domain-containing protein [Bacteroidetes bacterium]|nr:DUF4974 domain-containing protein [Bacteroidota bacterium]
MSPQEYIKLYEKYLSGSCTPEEEAALMRYQDNFKMQDAPRSPLSDQDKATRREIYSRIAQSIGPKTRTVRLKFWWAAASILLVVIAAVYFTGRQSAKPLAVNKNPDIKNTTPIKPGTTAATLTLANGSQIVLDDAHNGVLSNSGNTAITKTKNGQLAYVDNGTSATIDPNAKNTLVIPRGGQYMVTLSDSTKVWLNSTSSLTYPIAFTGNERAVTLTGEAYFEVAKNKAHPFIVHTQKMDVKVLGTHFNVDAYEDETDTKTTLLEGSVALSHQSSSILLTPGEQGIAGPAAAIRTRKVNTDHVTAWKQGYFVFRGDNIREIMKQISRWYDVDIVYEGNVTDEPFGGTYSRNKDITELLHGLELTELVHFKIEGRRIIVMK